MVIPKLILKRMHSRERANTVVIRLVYGVGLFIHAAVATASWQHTVSLDGRWHWQPALDDRQADVSSSFSWLAEYENSWRGGNLNFVFKPFLRIDQKDSERSHVDIREFSWIHAGDDWEFRLGFDKVFWGATEAYHLVDVINQTDLLENPDGEEKLGQPMLKYSLERGWGTLDAYWMPWFRERQFPGYKGRLRNQLRVDTDQTHYDTSLERFYPSFALRWSRSLDDWDIGVAHFHGISRAPRFTPGLAGNEPVLLPHYDVVNRTSLDLQGALGDWLWKFEALYQSGQGESYAATTGGFEYTWVGVAGSDTDLGVLFELMYDDRGDAATTPFNHDAFLGLRWVANDAQASEVLFGVVHDWDNAGSFLNLEASRRIGEASKASMQMRAWVDIDPDDVAYLQRQDDYIEARFTNYF
jgi:hypothetical protein